MALPQSINTATPASGDSPSGAPALFQNIKQFLVDVFGITDNTAYNVKAFSIDPTTGLLTFNVAGTVLKTAVLTQGTITDAALNLSGTATWNDGTETFTAWKLNITDTASAAASLLLDLQVGGTTKFAVKKDGSISTGSWGGTTLPVSVGGTGLTSTPTNGQLLIGNGSGFTLATLTGTSNQITVSGGAGSITLATPQNIHTAATPTFASMNLSATSNQLVLQSAGITGTLTWTPTSSNKTLTLPDATDTLVGKATTDTLTNKTLTTPTIGSFVNAAHTHEDAAGGATLSAAAIASGTLATARGGTNLNTSSSTGLPKISAGTWSVQALTSGQILIGSTGVVPVAATLTAGTGIDITNGAGSITIATEQDIDTAASVTFANLTLGASGALTIGSGGVITPAAVSGTPAQHGLYRESVVKAWVNFDGTEAVPVAADSFNLLSITDNGGTGIYTLTWDRDFAAATYAVAGAAMEVSGQPITVTIDSANGSMAAGALSIQTQNSAATAVNPTMITVIAIGTQ